MRGKVIGYIFRPRITLRDGTVIIATDYGLKAFRIPIYENRDTK